MQITNNFWEGLVSGLISGAIIAFFFGYLFIKWIDFYNRPKIKLEFEIKKLPNEQDVRGLILGIHNYGKKSLAEKEVNFHLYIPKNIEILEEYLNREGIQKMGISKVKGKEYVHYSQFNLKPIFPSRQISILKIFYPKTKNEYKIYYHFSTIHGLIPKRNSWFRKINKRNNEIRVNLLPYIEFE